MSVSINHLDKALPEPLYNGVSIDLYASSDVTVEADAKSKLVGTGISLDIDADVVGVVQLRSYIANALGMKVNNFSTMTIDPVYKDELYVHLVNNTNTEVSFKRGHRIAKLFFSPSMKVVPEFPSKVEDVSTTATTNETYAEEIEDIA